MTKDDTFVRITNRDIWEKLEEQDKKLDEQHGTQLKTLAHAELTNGRVTSLENKSWGVWVSNHPFKFVLFTLIFMALVVSDIRQPILMLLATYIPFL